MPAPAQEPACYLRSFLVQHLMAAQGERVVGEGRAIASTDIVIERFESDGGKTWTLVATTPGGVSCVIAIGRDWKNKRGRKL